VTDGAPGELTALARKISVIGVPSSAGAFANGQEEAPRALRAAGILDRLRDAGADVEDTGDSPVWRWRPDHERPRAQNLDAVVDQARATRARVASATRAGRTSLVLGGDCTVGIGTVAGVLDVHDSVGLIYFDLHADMNTPVSVIDGALDWTGVAHMLALDGTESDLAGVGPRIPMLRPDQVVLFGHGSEQATPWEREQIERLGVARVPVEAVRQDADAAAQRALELVRPRFDHYVVHLDVDVIDFTDAPLSENTGRNIGLSFRAAMDALRGLLADDGLVALTIAELNPAHALADDGLLERFAAAVGRSLAAPPSDYSTGPSTSS
jgi:arginase